MTEPDHFPQALPHPDWLRHDLHLSGPADQVAAFEAEAAGAGLIPWHDADPDHAEEDRFHALLRPPDGSPGLPVEAARTLARLLRAAEQAGQGRALDRAGRSRACPLDLHALLPVPPSVLRLGPADRAARVWLWAHWGTTWPLRHVRRRSDPDRRLRRSAQRRFEFWSADWTPWPAIRALRQRWPALVFEVRPDYADA